MNLSDLNPSKITRRLGSTIGLDWGKIASDNINAIRRYSESHKNTELFCIGLVKVNQNTYKGSKLYIAFFERSDFPEMIRGVKHYKFGVRINGECLGKDVDIADKFGPFMRWCKQYGKQIFKIDGNFNFNGMKKACKQADLEYDGLFFVAKNNNKVCLIKE